MSDEREQWSSFVRKLRAALQWSQQELGDAIGVSDAAVCRWEDDTERGRTPTTAARKSLIELARKYKLVK